MERDEEVLLYRQALKEMRNGSGYEATQKLLDYLEVPYKIEDMNVLQRVQLMLAQEEYVHIYDDEPPRYRDDEVMRYVLSDKDDFRAYVVQLIEECTRDKLTTTEQLKETVDKYNRLKEQTKCSGFQPISPQEHNSNTVYADWIFYKPPKIYGFESGDFESARLHSETLSSYGQDVENYFKTIAGRCLIDNVSMIHMSVDQVNGIVKYQDTKEEKTSKPKSKLSEFLSKFAEKSIRVASAAATPFRNPQPFGKLQTGMEIVIPAGCKDITTGEILPEIKTKILDIWGKGGQLMLSTDIGVLTTRDLSQDLNEILQHEIGEMEYKIEHAEEIAAKEAAEKAEKEYKTKWLERISSHIPRAPKDERLDMDDMTYYGYTTETFTEACIDRDGAYQDELSRYKHGATAYANEIAQKCISEGIRILYAEEGWRDHINYWGILSLPSCVDAITEQKIEGDALRVKNVWAKDFEGEKRHETDFTLIGENNLGEKFLITSIDIREAAQEIAQSLSPEMQNEVSQEETNDLEQDEGHERNN